MKNFIICILFLNTVFIYAQKNNDFIQINEVQTNKSVVNYELKKTGINNLNIPSSENFSYNRVIPVTHKGVTRFIDRDRSGTYKNLDKTYLLQIDEKGYTLKTDKGKFVANIRQNDNDQYIFANNKEISYLWFKNNGDMVVETYNLKEDVFIKGLYIKI